MIVVFGSINIDLVTHARRFPGPGETVMGGDYSASPGGKGANQALAARRAGAGVAMVGAYGRGGFADAALALLRAESVDLTRCRVVDAPTGAAFIVVDPNGENAIIVAAGANAYVEATQIQGLIKAGDTLLLQREIPDAEIEAAAIEAKRCGARVILNLAPMGAPSKALMGALDAICVNEHEALTLAQGLGLEETDPDAICRAVSQQWRIGAIATLGSAGAVGYDQGERFAAVAPKVDVVDTTGAGDTFIGVYAASLERGDSFDQAMRRGLAAGSLACTKSGAQPSMPTGAEIDAFLPAVS